MPGQTLVGLVPFHHTRGCSEDWALLLCVRQVTSHSPVVWFAGRRDAADLATLLCLVVAVTQSGAIVSLLWSKEVAEAWVCSATGAGLSCSHTRSSFVAGKAFCI